MLFDDLAGTNPLVVFLQDPCTQSDLGQEGCLERGAWTDLHGLDGQRVLFICQCMSSIVSRLAAGGPCRIQILHFKAPD
jgi:hypothetical protein